MASCFPLGLARSRFSVVYHFSLFSVLWWVTLGNSVFLVHCESPGAIMSPTLLSDLNYSSLSCSHPCALSIHRFPFAVSPDSLLHWEGLRLYDVIYWFFTGTNLLFTRYPFQITSFLTSSSFGFGSLHSVLRFNVLHSFFIRTIL